MNNPQPKSGAAALPSWSRDVFEQQPIAKAHERPASKDWEVERNEVGPNHNLSYLVSVHHKRVRGANRVLIATADIQRVGQVERAARRALDSLSSADFAELLKLPSPEE